MRTKINNHTVTRGYLANWKGVGESGETGIWYYDILHKEVCFSPTLKASFAISPGIYAPKYIGNDRDDRLENWFAESESHLCEFTRNYGVGKPKRWKVNRIKRAISAIVAHGSRGEYSVQAMEQHIKGQMPHLTNEELRLATLDNLYNACIERAQYFLRGSAIIIENDGADFCTNDQPFWDMSPRSEQSPMAVFPLSPKRFIVLAPNLTPKLGDMQIIFKSGAEFRSITEFTRTGALRMARRWVVCGSKGEAEKARSYLTDEVIAEAWSTDNVRFLSVDDRHRLFSLD